MAEGTPFALACPACRAPLGVKEAGARCEACGREYRREGGIWRCLLDPERYAAYLAQYRTVRAAEGWGSGDARYYRALPAVSRDDPQHAIWRVRARHFAELLRRLPGGALRVLDAGAGNGWLANQLALRGYSVAALDISDDARDGLGAHSYYDARFECYQAELERLPFAGAAFDAVIFNAALHHAPALAPALCEARRVLRAGGRIIVLDSPCYADAASGAAMVAERERRFAQAYGSGGTARTVGFIAWPGLKQAAADAGLRIVSVSGDDGWRERVRRVWTAWRVGRVGARFPVVVLES